MAIKKALTIKEIAESKPENQIALGGDKNVMKVTAKKPTIEEMLAGITGNPANIPQLKSSQLPSLSMPAEQPAPVATPEVAPKDDFAGLTDFLTKIKGLMPQDKQPDNKASITQILGNLTALAGNAPVGLGIANSAVKSQEDRDVLQGEQEKQQQDFIQNITKNYVTNKMIPSAPAGKVQQVQYQDGTLGYFNPLTKSYHDAGGNVVIDPVKWKGAMFNSDYLPTLGNKLDLENTKKVEGEYQSIPAKVATTTAVGKAQIPIKVQEAIAGIAPKVEETKQVGQTKIDIEKKNSGASYAMKNPADLAAIDEGMSNAQDAIGMLDKDASVFRNPGGFVRWGDRGVFTTKMATAINALLKSRSGSAVTDPESERFNKAYLPGAWDSEEIARMKVESLYKVIAASKQYINDPAGGKAFLNSQADQMLSQLPAEKEQPKENPISDALDPEKRKRLAELRAKAKGSK